MSDREIRPMPIVGVVVAGAVAALSFTGSVPATAGPGTNQVIDAKVDVSKYRLPVLRACVGRVCETVAVSTRHDADLLVRLSSSALPSIHASDIEVRAGLPEVCRRLVAGQVEEHPGLSIAVLSTRITDESALEVRHGGEVVLRLRRDDAAAISESLHASVCLTTS